MQQIVLSLEEFRSLIELSAGKSGVAAAPLAIRMAKALLYVIDHHKGLESEQSAGNCHGLLAEIDSIVNNQS